MSRSVEVPNVSHRHTKSSLSRATLLSQSILPVLLRSVKVSAPMKFGNTLMTRMYVELTDAIKEDWGGKPFIGMYRWFVRSTSVDSFLRGR